MNENTKSIGFVIVAVALVTLAVVLRHEDRTSDIPEDVGQKLFPAFDDPLKATSLEIVKFDEDQGKAQRFKVAQVNGDWTIPSHEGYPADAKQQVAKAATSVIDLEILGVASDLPGDHAEFGVVEPTETAAASGKSGIGTLLVLQDGTNDLARLVIGKELSGKEGIHYVRRVGQDRVYTVAVDTTPLSTKFNDWIETDLLQLNSTDLNYLVLNDYTFAASITETGEIGIEIPRNSTITLGLKPNTSEWQIEKLVEYKDNQPSDVTLDENQKLNTQKLSDLRSALDSLKIVDVERKPEGMSGNLRAAESFLKDRDAITSLAQRGFFFAREGDQPPQLYSSEGELIAGTKDGVQYVLRFGKIAGVSDDDAAKPAGENTAETADASKDGEDASSVNRYLFVLAEFNQDLIAKPELKELPKIEEPAPNAETTPADASSTTENAPDSKPAGEDASGEAIAASPQDPAADAAKPAGENTQGQIDPAGSEKKLEDVASIEAQRKAIEAENTRNQKDYDEKVAAGKKKVEQLNGRFADWYYIIPDDVYRKIHLTRADIIETKTADAAAGDTAPSTDPAAGLPPGLEGLIPQQQ